MATMNCTDVKNCSANEIEVMAGVPNEIEVMLAEEKAFQQKQKNKALIAEYRAVAAAQGKVWRELNEEEITKMIIDHESKKALALAAQEAALPCSVALKHFKEQGVPVPVLAPVQPPTWFDLSSGSSTQVLNHIHYLTNGLTLFAEDFVDLLYERIILRPLTTFGYMPAPPNADICKQVIGKDGYYFKLTTNNTDVDFIWHDREKNNFLFWGERTNVIQAMKIIRSRIIKTSNISF